MLVAYVRKLATAAAEALSEGNRNVYITIIYVVLAVSYAVGLSFTILF